MCYYRLMRTTVISIVFTVTLSIDTIEGRKEGRYGRKKGSVRWMALRSVPKVQRKGAGNSALLPLSIINKRRGRDASG